jgi:hypothetical protein
VKRFVSHPPSEGDVPRGPNKTSSTRRRSGDISTLLVSFMAECPAAGQGLEVGMEFLRRVSCTLARIACCKPLIQRNYTPPWGWIWYQRYPEVTPSPLGTSPHKVAFWHLQPCRRRCYGNGTLANLDDEFQGVHVFSSRPNPRREAPSLPSCILQKQALQLTISDAIENDRTPARRAFALGDRRLRHAEAKKAASHTYVGLWSPK